MYWYRYLFQTDEGPIEEADEVLFSLGRAGLAFVVVLVVGRGLLVPAVTRVIRVRNRRNPTLVAATRRYLSGLVLLIAVVVAVGAGGYGYLLGGSAVVVAAVTLAVGVAGREVIGDVVSGMFLVADPDFNIGDWISWPDGEGNVEAISYRVTRVRTPDNAVVIVPNTTLATSQVTHPYGRREFRITADVDVDYDTDFDAVADALGDEAIAIDGVERTREPDTWVAELGGDAVRLCVAFWVVDPERDDVVRIRSAFYKRAVARLEEMGVDLNPPSRHELSGGIDTKTPTDAASSRETRE